MREEIRRGLWMLLAAGMFLAGPGVLSARAQSVVTLGIQNAPTPTGEIVVIAGVEDVSVDYNVTEDPADPLSNRDKIRLVSVLDGSVVAERMRGQNDMGSVALRTDMAPLGEFRVEYVSDADGSVRTIAPVDPVATPLLLIGDAAAGQLTINSAEPDLLAGPIVVSGENFSNTQIFDGTVSIYVPGQGDVALTVTGFDLANQEITADLPAGISTMPGTFLLTVSTGTASTQTDEFYLVVGNGILIEVDPTVNELARASLPCVDGEVAKYDAATSTWVCSSDVVGGDMTGVTAGFGLTGGGLSGDVSLAVDNSVFQARVTGICPSDYSMKEINADGTVVCALETDPTVIASVKDGVDWMEVSGIPAGFADNVDDVGLLAEVDPTVNELARANLPCVDGEVAKFDAATSSWVCGGDAVGGDMTGVTAGFGLTGGGLSGDVSLNVDTAVIQNRVSESCAVGSSIREINSDGTVVCESNSPGSGISFEAMDVFTSSGIWTKPADVNRVYVKVVGAGGGGGGSSSLSGGGGGGAGGYSEGFVTVTGNIAVSIGTGGTSGGGPGASAYPGSSSSFSGISAFGGGGGQNANGPTPGNGGGGGGASGGQLNTTGQAGMKGAGGSPISLADGGSPPFASKGCGGRAQPGNSTGCDGIVVVYY